MEDSRLDQLAIDLRAVQLALGRETGHLRVQRAACDARLDDTLLGCLQRGIRFRCQRHRLCNRLR